MWAVFLDRDGTVNEEVEYLDDPARLRLIVVAADAIWRPNPAGVPVVLVSNQAGVGRGYFDEAVLGEIHRELARQLAIAGARLDAIYYCPHHPEDGCHCRKPRPGMLLRAAAEHDLDLLGSFAVGDKLSDLEAGRRAGCRTALVLTGYGSRTQQEVAGGDWRPDLVGESLADAVSQILSLPASQGQGNKWGTDQA